jgi:hypothetical protein
MFLVKFISRTFCFLTTVGIDRVGVYHCQSSILGGPKKCSHHHQRYFLGVGIDVELMLILRRGVNQCKILFTLNGNSSIIH